MDARAGQVSALGAASGTAAIAGLLALAPTASAWACGEALPPPTDRVANARYEIVFAARPDPIAAGKHFSLDIAVCPRDGAPPPTALRVDAVMPEHRHGMNYRPDVAARGAGVYRADGLMFHMPGRWDIFFDLVTGSGTERLTATKELE
jgi:hypothetical protein